MTGGSAESGLRTPPQAIDVERALLGAILLDSSAFNKVADLLDDTTFYRPQHISIFRAMRALAAASEPIDVVTVIEQLRRDGKLEEIGGSLYLSDLMDQVGSAANAEHYAQTIHEKALLRRVIAVNTESITEAYDPSTRSEPLIDEILTKLTRLSRDGVRRAIPARTAAFQTIDYVTKLKSTHGFLTGITSGFERMDDFTSGFRPSELIIVAARPSMGKTSLAMNIAQAAAEKQNCPTAIFSLEMDYQQLLLRMLSREAKIGLHSLRSSIRLKPPEWDRLVEAADRLAKLPLFFDDTAGLTIESLRARSRQMHQEHGLGLIVIDYLQLIQPPKMADNLQQWVAFVSASLKHLAKDLRVPIICLSQLSRAPETRGGDRKPVLSDLRDSGAIEQDADVVMFVYRPEVYKDSMKSKQYDFEGKKYDFDGLAEIIVAKNRNGPTGHFLMTFLGKFTSFENFIEEGAIPASVSERGDEEDAADEPGHPF
jgi:replicative DNA helicase